MCAERFPRSILCKSNRDVVNRVLIAFLSNEKQDLDSESSKGRISSQKESYLRKWFTKTVRHVKSLQEMESRAVGAAVHSLQHDVILDMGLNFTNPSVSSIALQASSSLQAFKTMDLTLNFPTAFIERLRSQFRECFQRGTSKGRAFSISAPYSIAERYTRAMLLFPDHMAYSECDWDRIISFSPPKDLRAAALLAGAAQHAGDLWPLMQSSRELLQFILDLPPVEVLGIHPWHYQSFVGATKALELTCPFSTEDQGEMVTTMLNSLTLPSKALTLQEDILIRTISACRGRKTSGRCLIEDESSVQKASDVDEVGHSFLHSLIDFNWVQSKSRETLMKFMMHLPDIISFTPLTSENQDRLMLLLLRMNITHNNPEEQVGELEIVWDSGKEIFCPSDSDYPLLVKSIEEMLLQLISGEVAKWTGDLLLRIKVVVTLSDTLKYGAELSNGTITSAILHWIFSLATSTPDLTLPKEEARSAILRDLLYSLFPHPYAGIHTSILLESLNSCLTFVSSYHLIGLPTPMLGFLVKRIRNVRLRDPKEHDFLVILDALFRCFIKESYPHKPAKYIVTGDESLNTLLTLVDIVRDQKSRSVRWQETLAGWRKLVRNRNFMSDEVPRRKESDRHSVSTAKTLAPGDSIDWDPLDTNMNTEVKPSLDLVKLLRRMEAPSTAVYKDLDTDTGSFDGHSLAFD